MLKEGRERRGGDGYLNGGTDGDGNSIGIQAFNVLTLSAEGRTGGGSRVGKSERGETA